MIADTNDKRTHTFYRLTTSPRVRIGSPAAPSKLRWNRDCLGLQSSKTVPIPPQLRRDSAAWRCWPCAGKRIPAWGLGMGCAFRRGRQTETAAHNSVEKWAAVSQGSAKSGGLLAYSPSSAFSGVIGSERTWWPVACATAEATAASGVLMTTSPIDLAPNGPVGS